MRDARSYMPGLYSALGVHPLCGADALLEALADHRQAVDECGDALGYRDGVDLGPRSLALRKVADAGAGVTWSAVFDTVASLVEAAMGPPRVEARDTRQLSLAGAT
jgi:hypothetical protein